MLSFGSASSALPQHQEVLDRLRRTSAQLDTLQRRLAFERVYEEGRWKNGAGTPLAAHGLWHGATWTLDSAIQSLETHSLV